MTPLLLFFAALAPGAQVAASAPVGATQADAAARLAATVLPVDTAVAVRVPRAEAQFAETFADDGRIAALESRRPGLRAALMVAVREEAATAYREAATQLQSDVARIYRDRFAPAELATLTRFFASPTGQAMITLSMESSGATAAAFDADRRSKLVAMLRDPSDQTKADLTLLMESGLLPKVRQTNPAIAELSQRRFGDVDTLLSDRLPARIDRLIAAHGKDAQ